MTLADYEKVYLEKYKLLVQFISNQGTTFWAVFGIFMAANAFMLVDYVGSKDMPPFFKIVAPIFAISVNIFWLLVSGRDIALRHINIQKARRLLKKIDTGKVDGLEIWGENREIEGKVLSFKGIRGVSGLPETIFVFLLFIYAIIAVWIILLWNNLSELPRSIIKPLINSLTDSFFIGILIVIAIVASVDVIWRWRANKEFKEEYECKGGVIRNDPKN